MPNRLIKESICTSDDIDKLSWFEEVVWYRLIVNCDDFGRFDGRPAIIKNRLFPLKDSVTLKAVSAAINKLVSFGMVALYEFECKPYLYLPSWNEHQTPRATKSKYPDPATGNITSESNGNQLNADECNGNQLNADAHDIRIRNSYSDSISESKGSRFAPPTLDEVKAYCEERKNGIDAQHFIDYYSRQGWMLSNGRKMKDWKATVRTWEQREKKTTTVTKRNNVPCGGDADPAVVKAAYLRLCEELGEDPEETA